MNKSTLVFGIIGLLIIVGIAYMGFRSQPPAQPVMTGTSATTGADSVATGKDSTSGATIGQPDTVVDVNGVKTVNIEASNYRFSVPEIRVKKGDTVKIVFTVKQGFHDWTIDEFNTHTKQMKDGGTETVEFTADKAGTFEYYCSVQKHRAMGMTGNLIVE